MKKKIAMKKFIYNIHRFMERKVIMLRKFLNKLKIEIKI